MRKQGEQLGFQMRQNHAYSSLTGFNYSTQISVIPKLRQFLFLCWLFHETFL